jgi:uncharacterized protein (TIGR00730 family)
MAAVRSVCVFCGSSGRVHARYRAAAAELGALLAANGISLVFGGGHIGLMGVIADAVLAGGGQAIGVIPEFLVSRELAHTRLTELHVVPSMHARKQTMFELSDAFAALPGGVGTLEETLEVITWRELSLHDKPIVLVNVADYWQPLLELFDHISAERFTRRHKRLFAVADGPQATLDALAKAPEPSLEPTPERT